MAPQRLTVRDFKKTGRRNGADSGTQRLRDIGIGLAMGLAVAAVIYISDHRRPPPETETAPQPRAPSKAAEAAAAAEAEEPAQQFDFYDMLPRFEVVVPEKGERDVRRDLPAARVERPGVYVLQAGSYRSQPDAERVRAQLAKQGITATVQRVAVDADVWHRVRIGPIRDLNQLNRLRDHLRAADIDALVIRVGD